MEMGRKLGFDFAFGVVLVAVSLFMLFKNAYVSTIRFYTLGRVNTGAVLVVLLILAIIFAVVRPGAVSYTVIGAVVAGLVVSLLLGMHIGFRHMTLVDVLLIVGPMAVGVGLVLRALFRKED